MEAFQVVVRDERGTIIDRIVWDTFDQAIASMSQYARIFRPTMNSHSQASVALEGTWIEENLPVPTPIPGDDWDLE